MEELINWAVSASRAKLCVVFILLASVPGTEAGNTHSGEKKQSEKECIPELSGLFKVTEQLAV